MRRVSPPLPLSFFLASADFAPDSANSIFCVVKKDAANADFKGKRLHVRPSSNVESIFRGALLAAFGLATLYRWLRPSLQIEEVYCVSATPST